MPLSFSDRVRVAPDVLFRLLSDEAVLVNLKTERYLGLNAVGARMWNVLTTADSVQSAYEALLREYDVESSRLRADLTGFLDQLVDQQLIEAIPPGPS